MAFPSGNTSFNRVAVQARLASSKRMHCQTTLPQHSAHEMNGEESLHWLPITILEAALPTTHLLPNPMHNTNGQHHPNLLSQQHLSPAKSHGTTSTTTKKMAPSYPWDTTPAEISMWHWKDCYTASQRRASWLKNETWLYPLRI